MGSESQISEEAVRKATGKGWDHWFRVLDRWKAAEKGHKATAAYLYEEHGLPGWWAQGVTVRYEKERGLRVLGQRGRSFEMSVTRTVAAPAARCFEAFLEPKEQSIWFTSQAKADLRVGGRYRNADGDQGQFLAIQPPKRLRFTWENAKHCPGTVVEVAFLPKGRAKTQIALTHSKLSSMKDREAMRLGWSWAMDSYRCYIETGRPIPNEEWEKARKANATKAEASAGKKAPAKKSARRAGGGVKKPR